MWRYLLDANAIVIFQRAGRLVELAAAAGSIQMAIVEEVRDELLTQATGPMRLSGTSPSRRIREPVLAAVAPA